MKLLQARIADLWCKLMHAGLMWPSHGHYECLTCGRQYPVSWEEPSLAVPLVPASPHGTSVRPVLAPAT